MHVRVNLVEASSCVLCTLYGDGYIYVKSNAVCVVLDDSAWLCNLPLDEHVCSVVSKQSWEHVCPCAREAWQGWRFPEAA